MPSINRDRDRDLDHDRKKEEGRGASGVTSLCVLWVLCGDLFEGNRLTNIAHVFEYYDDSMGSQLRG